jgi:hypothetical protein
MQVELPKKQQPTVFLISPLRPGCGPHGLGHCRASRGLSQAGVILTIFFLEFEDHQNEKG